ncbi:MAG: N-acetylornithine carbamoyltransferase [Chloroflexota bacterium]|nr:N-acetylornithine carbamoyltransferase [Chloroflexota bacterium]
MGDLTVVTEAPANQGSTSSPWTFRGQDFINTAEMPQEAFVELVERALRLKREGAGGGLLLDGMVVGMVFFNPSLRTKTSLAAGVARLGGTTIDLAVGQSTYAFEFEEGVVMNKATQEHIKEAAPVLSQYCDVIAVRSSDLVTRGSEAGNSSATWEEARKDTVVRSFAKYASVPVINLESNAYHPCQGLGDALTLREQFGKTQGKKYVLTWAYHPKPLPTATPHSQLLQAIDMGCDVTLAFPQGWDLDVEVTATAYARAEQAGGSLTISHDIVEAAQGADVICCKSWGALSHYGDWETEKAIREGLKHWIVNEAIMASTNNGKFMHCLPVRRNVEVTDGVLDSPSSIVVQEAGNRMHAQNALIASLLGRWH